MKTKKRNWFLIILRNFTPVDRQVLGRLHHPGRCLELHRLLIARALLAERPPVGTANLKLEKGLSRSEVEVA